MADQPSVRLNKVLRELNISLDRAVEFLNQKGIEIDARPTTKITTEVYTTLLDEFETDKSKKVASHEVSEEKRKEKETLRIIQEKKEQERLDQIAKRESLKTNIVALEKPKSLGKIDLEALKRPAKKEVVPQEKEVEIIPEVAADLPQEIEEAPVHISEPEVEIVAETEPVVQEPHAEEKAPEAENETLKTQYQKFTGPKKTGQTINLDEVNKKEKTVEDARKRKRKRISKDVKPSPSSRTDNKTANTRGNQ